VFAANCMKKKRYLILKFNYTFHKAKHTFEVIMKKINLWVEN